MLVKMLQISTLIRCQIYKYYAINDKTILFLVLVPNIFLKNEKKISMHLKVHILFNA